MSADRFQNLLVRPAGFAHHLAVLGLPTTELPTSSVAVQVFELLHDVLHGNTATDSEELDDLVGKVSPCCGVTLLADDLGDLPLTGIGHSLVARELVPEVVLDPVGQTWFIASSHGFLSGLPSLLMVRDDFRLHSVLNQDTHPGQ